MANGIKTYQIEINGLKESADAVKVLNAELDSLEQRIKALEGKAINVGSKTSTESTSSLDAQDKLQKDILATEQKLAEVRDENYKKLLHMKEELKEYTQIAKSQVAAEENQQGLYDTNTMAGMKGQLKSIKQEMQTIDISSDRFRELSQQANDLNNKLKEIEQSYGQYGRNVGNYANGVAEGIEKLKIDVGGVIQEFDSAKEALVKLRKEMQTLSTKKDLGLISEEEAERLKNLVPTVAQLKSAIEDAGKPMDALLDTMQSFAAIASVSQGISALFGMDDSKIQQTIQKLVALQNVLQGIQTIQKQMQEQQGIGGWLSKGSAAADKLAVSIIGVGKATKTATVATKALSLAFKGLGIGLIITAVTGLISLFDSFIEKQKKAAEETKRVQEVAKKSAVAYNMAKQELTTYASIIDNFNGTKEEEKKLVDELNDKYGQAIGTYKTLSQWKDALIKKTEDYCEVLAIEAEMAAATHRLEEAYAAQVDAKNYDPSIWEWAIEGGAAARIRVQAMADQEVKEAEKAQAEIFKKLQAKKQESGLFDFSPQVDKDGKKTKKAVVDVEALIAKARVDAMKEGFTKTMTELLLERDKRIAEAKKSGRMVQEQIELINRTYEAKIFNARVEYHNKLIEEEIRYADRIKKIHEDLYQQQIQNSLDKNQLNYEENMNNVGLKDTFFLTIDYDSKDISKFNEELVNTYINSQNVLQITKQVIDEVGDGYDKLSEEGKKIYDNNKKIFEEAKTQIEEIEKLHPGIKEIVNESGAITSSLKEAYDLRTSFRQKYYERLLELATETAAKELEIEKDKIDKEQKMQADAENKRHKLAASRIYDDEYKDRKEYSKPRSLYEGYINEGEKGNLVDKDKDEIGLYFAEYREQMDKWLDNLKKGVQKGEYTWEEYFEFMNQEAIQAYLKAKDEYENFLLLYNKMSDDDKKKNEGKLKEYTANLNNAYVDYLEKVKTEQDIHNNTMNVMEKNFQNQRKKVELDNLKTLQNAYADYYNSIINETEIGVSAINRKIEKATKVNSFQIINLSETRKGLKDLESAINAAFGDIEKEKANLLNALNKGQINFEQYDALIGQLKSLETQATETAGVIKQKLKNLIEEWWGSVNNWVQAVGQTMNSVLSSLSEIQSNQYDAMIEQQQKYIDEYEELLDRQEQITQEHASEVDSIEDELASSRGDRRQHLIDQLNAEMEAQRASLAEEERIRKQKERAEKKQKKLEHDQAVAKKKMQEAQAYINMAMAISMAAVNSWPIPAIPMMALAAAAGAAQIAAIKSQNIPSYGDGGIILGKSHKQGGVKVLGGRAEVEGGEFITNRISTQMNAPLLEFINSKKKRIDVSDLLEFYSSSSAKKGVVGIKTKFEDGGYMPPLPNALDVRDQLQNIIINQDTRPIYVSVVDINNKQEQVRRVQTLAGL